jgi:thiamine-monophosphate kinase
MTRTVADLGEKRIIRELVKPIFRGGAAVGVGDDGAILDIPPGEQLVVSTDKIPEDLLSIQLGLMDPYSHGRYLAAVNVSDIAAMGGKPLALLCTIALPNDFSLDYLEEFLKGLAAAGQEWGAPIVGGDTGWGSSLCMSATAVGSIEPGLALLRSSAKVGDRIFVSGTIGGFGTALAYFIVAKPLGLRLREEWEYWLKARLIRPVPRIETGRSLALSGNCTACMDITDGVGQSLRELAEASDVHLGVDVNSLPLHPSTEAVAKFLNRPIEHLVFGIGLDLELMGTYREATPLPSGLTAIGRVEGAGQGVTLKYGSRSEPLLVPGWQHFSGSAMEIARQLYARQAQQPPP